MFTKKRSLYQTSRELVDLGKDQTARTVQHGSLANITHTEPFFGMSLCTLSDRMEDEAASEDSRFHKYEDKQRQIHSMKSGSLSTTI